MFCVYCARQKGLWLYPTQCTHILPTVLHWKIGHTSNATMHDNDVDVFWRIETTWNYMFCFSKIQKKNDEKMHTTKIWKWHGKRRERERCWVTCDTFIDRIWLSESREPNASAESVKWTKNESVKKYERKRKEMKQIKRMERRWKTRLMQWTLINIQLAIHLFPFRSLSFFLFSRRHLRPVIVVSTTTAQKKRNEKLGIRFHTRIHYCKPKLRHKNCSRFYRSIWKFDRR